MAKTTDPAVETDGKGISAPPADGEKRATAPADGDATSPEADVTEEEFSTTGKGIS